MAKTLSKSGIATGDTIEPGHVTQSIDAFTGVDAYDLTLSGSLDITGSLNLPTGSILEGTASLSNFSISSSHAITASYALFSEGGGGGGGNPQGPDTSVQFRNGGNFSGNGNFTYDNSANLLTSLSSSLGFITSSYILASTISASTIQAETFVGDISADEIRTPALINGVASTLENASSSITPLGFAKFVSASIGGWDIDTGSIQSPNMIMRPEGIIQTKNFASGQTGWRISAEGNGTAEFENARIRGTLRTTTFEKESVNAVGGQLWVVNSTTISQSVSETATTMSVANASGFSQGEILMAKKVDNTGFSTEYILVNSSSIDGDGSGDDQTFGRIMVTRAYGQGQQGDFVGDIASTSQSYSDGQVLVSTAKSGSGFIKLNANPNDVETPFIDITERTGSGIYDVQLKARLGDLSGLANSDKVFNRPNPGFGLATDNVFLQGGIKATFGEIGGFNITDSLISSSNQNIILKSSGQITASDGFLFGNKATSNYVAYEGGTLTVRGDLTVDNIKTPATIAGSPSTETNASASINALGFARFTSASIAGFTVNTSEIKSSDDSLRLKADGNITASKVLLGDKSGGNFLQFDGSTLTVQGSITADNISTPSNLSGTDVSSSINSDGFALFKSASIGGFDISPSTIRQFTPASSSNETINTNVSMSFNVPNTTTGGSNSTTVSSIVTNSTSDAIFNDVYIKADSSTGDEFGFGGGNQTIGRISSINTSTGALTLYSGYTWGSYYDEAPITKTFRLYSDSGATISTFTSSSTHTTNFPATESILIDAGNQKIVVGGTSGNNLILNGANGTITASAANISGKITADEGVIGGTVIESSVLKSSLNLPSPDGSPAFKLDSDGIISGSDMLLRNVYKVNSVDTKFTLVDTNQGFFIGRNIGRQVVSNNTEISMTYAGGVYVNVYSEVFNLLPFEDKFLLAFTSLHENSANTTGQSADLSFRIATMNTGSANGASTYYNSWNNETSIYEFPVSVRDNGTLSPRSFSRNSQSTTANNIAIPTAYQSQTIRFSVYARMSHTTCSAKIRGISLIATNAFASDFQTNAVLQAETTKS